MHRADPSSDRLPSPHGHRRQSPPGGGGPSMLLQPPDPGPADLTPYRARVWIREVPQRPPRKPGVWIGRYRVRALDVVCVALIAAALAAYFWWR